jgi:hypothetical protein
MKQGEHINHARGPHMKTAYDIAVGGKRNNPTKRVAYDNAKGAVGIWSESLGRYVMVASATITGQWVEMPYEIRVNGELPAFDWIECTQPIPDSISI